MNVTGNANMQASANSQQATTAQVSVGAQQASAGTQQTVNGKTAAGQPGAASLFELILSGQMPTSDAVKSPVQDLLDLLSGLDANQLSQLLAMLGMPNPQALQKSGLPSAEFKEVAAAATPVPLQTAISVAGLPLTLKLGQNQPELKQVVQAAIADLLQKAGVPIEDVVKQLKQSVQNDKKAVPIALENLIQQVKQSLSAVQASVTTASLAVEVPIRNVETKAARKTDLAALQRLVPTLPISIEGGQPQAVTPKDQGQLHGQTGDSGQQQTLLKLTNPLPVQTATVNTETDVVTQFASVLSSTTHAATTQSSSQAPAQVHMNQGQFTADFPNMVVKQATLLGNGGASEMRITLMPEGLGEVKVVVHGENGQISLLISADTSQARSLLDGSLGALRQQLESQGMQVNRMEVTSSSSADFMSMDQGMLEGQNKQGQEWQSPNQGNQRLAADMIPFEESMIYQQELASDDGRIDYTA